MRPEESDIIRCPLVTVRRKNETNIALPPRADACLLASLPLQWSGLQAGIITD